MRLSTLLISTFVLLVSACTNTAEQNNANAMTVVVYKYAGSTQCQNSKTSTAAMKAQLTDAGIRVFSSTCGVDGKMRISMCGAPDGKIFTFSISASQTEAAYALGFASMSTLPHAVSTSCSE